jgi:tRNA(Ile)-lysidine synthase
VPDKQSASVQEAFERALGAILARVSVSGSADASDRAAADRQSGGLPAVGLAYSGGLDSTVLLHLACAWAAGTGRRLHAFHVHHGLSPHANAWLRHAEQECARLGVPLHAAHVNVDSNGDGIEQGARKRRYAALGRLCREHGVRLLLTGHHLDDQAETVLLQMLRGAGVAGIAGMQESVEAQGLLGVAGLLLGRPLLGVAREALESFAREMRVAWVDDESNDDLRFSRNALRHAVMPALAGHFPGFQERLARGAAHAGSARRLLNEIAAEDLASCGREDGSIDLARLRGSPDRIANLMRHWFTVHQVRMPSTAWLDQMLRQALGAREDAQVRVVHPDCEVHRHRNRLFLIPRIDDAALRVAPATFRWQREAALPFPAFGGILQVRTAGEEDRNWLAARSLELRYRSGGEVLKPGPNRPSRSLKHHYQALGIPAWERRRLPLVLADGRLLYAAGIGMNHAVLPPGAGISFEWERATT